MALSDEASAGPLFPISSTAASWTGDALGIALGVALGVTALGVALTLAIGFTANGVALALHADDAERTFVFPPQPSACHAPNKPNNTAAARPPSLAMSSQPLANRA